MANKKPLKLSETHACAQQFESGDTIAAAFIENGVPRGGTAGQVLAKIDGTNYNTEWVDQTGGGGGASYLVYTALLTQSGTSAPVATVLENTLGGTVTWIYEDVGDYSATLTGAFTTGKTWIIVGTDTATFSSYHTNPNSVGITSPAGNGALSSRSIEIRVYP